MFVPCHRLLDWVSWYIGRVHAYSINYLFHSSEYSTIPISEYWMKIFPPGKLMRDDLPILSEYLESPIQWVSEPPFSTHIMLRRWILQRR